MLLRMSVRDGLLAILTLGPAYGLQLHTELMSRAPHRKPVNAGQVYGTLERLGRQGLLHVVGATIDGLPLYALTPSGETAAAAWMSQADARSLPEWTEMLDQILITSSVDSPAATQLVRAYRQWWEHYLAVSRGRTVTDVGQNAGVKLALRAREAQSLSALDWLAAADATLAEGHTGRPLSGDRPKRGRKPAHTG
jgi:DNA-binding PadR family transcriptional regulator